MTVYSMTGYASVLAPAPGAGGAGASGGTALALELRSVNGRFLDLVFKLPEELRGAEPALREMLAAGLRRGKVELRLATQREAETGVAEPTDELLESLARADDRVRARLHDARPLSVHEVLQWARAGSAGSAAATPTAAGLEEGVLEAARRGLHALREARAREGDKLVAMLRACIDQLRTLAGRAAPLVPQVVQRQRERFLARWHEALEAAGAASTVPAAALQERALNEAAAFAIRIDVAEELSRLSAHLDEIERLLAAGGELGKRLDFLIQELHREANTLGSKSAALELTAISVEMKVLVEQMREQVQNIE
ncbi:MAG: YicC/YloC family endoribonuclease [Rubrivivax sp.]